VGGITKKGGRRVWGWGVGESKTRRKKERRVLRNEKRGNFDRVGVCISNAATDRKYSQPLKLTVTRRAQRKGGLEKKSRGRGEKKKRGPGYLIKPRRKTRGVRDTEKKTS